MSLVATIYQAFAFASSSFVLRAFAAGGDPPDLKAVLDGIFGGSGIVNIFLFTLAPAVGAVMIAYAGFQKIMAADNAQAVKQADQIIFWTVLGYLGVLTGWLLIGLGLGIAGYTNPLSDIFNINFN